MADLKEYKCFKNNKYQVLTQDGFRDFKGLIVGSNPSKIRLTFSGDKELVCTPKHKLLTDKEGIVYVQDVVIGDRLYGDVEVIDINTYTDDRRVYELLEVEKTHTYYANSVLSHQCLVIDEMAFIETHLIEEFWKSVFPVITSSKKSKVFVCSTANGSDNLFHTLYKGAVNGENGWAHDKIMWDEVPGRDERWVNSTKQAIGSRDAWRQEFQSCSGETLVTIEDCGDLPMEDLYNKL
jgi:hypothetical protein